MMIVELLHQLLQRKNLFCSVRAPAKKGNEINDCLRQKSLLDQIFVRRMTAAFRQFLMFFIRNQWAVYIFRHFPAKCVVKAVVFRRGRKIFISPHNMRNAH